MVLKRGKGRFFRDMRSSMVYRGAVASCIPTQSRALAPADPVVVVDGVHEMVGYGFYNAKSIFQVRLLRHGLIDDFDVQKDIERRLRDAFALRRTLGLPNGDTNAFRVVNGEGDRLSGLTVDFYSNVLVVSSSAIWCERYRSEIERGLAVVVPTASNIIWRRSLDRLRQDGFEDASDRDDSAQVPTVEDQLANAVVHEQETAANSMQKDAGIVVLENGVRYTLPMRTLFSGQKTGHYTDQRDARAFLKDILAARGDCAHVLDLFCYTAGFGLSAALAGARVTCVDSSARAVELGAENARLNGVAELVDFVRSDISKFLMALSVDELFDVVICDPPKFAPNAKALPRAVRKYRALNAAAMKRVRHGGLFLTCSCSAAVARQKDLFLEITHKAACDADREVALLKNFGTAADHPVAPDALDGDYLTACLFVCYERKTS